MAASETERSSVTSERGPGFHISVFWLNLAITVIGLLPWQHITLTAEGSSLLATLVSDYFGVTKYVDLACGIQLHQAVLQATGKPTPLQRDLENGLDPSQTGSFTKQWQVLQPNANTTARLQSRLFRASTRCRDREKYIEFSVNGHLCPGTESC